MENNMIHGSTGSTERKNFRLSHFRTDFNDIPITNSKFFYPWSLDTSSQFVKSEEEKIRELTEESKRLEQRLLEIKKQLDNLKHFGE